MTEQDTDLACINRSDDPENGCDGKTELRAALSGTGIPYPRCDKHWAARLVLESELRQRYPDSDIPPADFDPAYAGERWNEDDPW